MSIKSAEKRGIQWSGDRHEMVGVAGVTSARELGNENEHITELTFVPGAEMDITDNDGVVGHGGLKIGTFPGGAINVKAVDVQLTLTRGDSNIDAAFEGDLGVGTAEAGSDNSLSGTEADLVASTAVGAAESGETEATAWSTDSELPATFDGSSTAKDVYLNQLIDHADISDDSTLKIAGTIRIHWDRVNPAA